MSAPQEIDRQHAGCPVQAVECLLLASQLEAQRCQFETVVEVSDRSESVYLHVCRAGVWYGFRIACHEPFYHCSADYTQMIIPRVVSKEDLAHYERYMRRAIQVGGKVVADPREVETSIAVEEKRLRCSAKPSRLSALAKCEIRHRLNFLASWSEDERKA